MDLSRRDFLKFGGTGMGALVLLKGKGLVDRKAAIETVPLHKKVGEKNTICPFDASGCGFLVATETEGGKDKVVHIEGDPDHPINRGAACSKGASLQQTSADNPFRLSKVLYRRPGGDDWEEKDWDWAISNIADRIKKTRDESFIETNSSGRVVNRTEAIANLGGSALDNEECYLLVKLARALGLVYIEHHARI
jgi:formate dehydrogenase major subunit